MSRSLIQRVAAAMGEIAPLQLADRSWDNVGILVESPESNGSGVVFLTVDLTPDVMQECIKHNVEVIVAYHPPIFTPMKRLTLDNVKQKIILQAVRHGMSIYSPHTALDAVSGGINDWLAEIIDPNSFSEPIQKTDSLNGKEMCGAATPSTGMGRVVHLKESIPIAALIARVKNGLKLPHVRVALPEKWNNESHINSVAVCAGSGAGVFRELKISVDALLSGEMGHHDVLAANASGQAVVLCEHTNTERGFLEQKLLPQLKQRLSESVRFLVSQIDKDPLTVW